MADDPKDKLLEGYRRAHSWLRFNELGDQESIAELRRGLADPDDYRWVCHGLSARSRRFLQQLFVTARDDLRRAHEDLDRQMYATTPGDSAWEEMAEQWLEIANGLGKQWRPSRQSRLDLYEKAALDGLEAELPDSEMRRRMFGS